MIATIESGNTYYNHQDHLSGSNVITNQYGVVAEYIDYYPFGAIRQDQKTSSFNEKKKFTGHYFDADTGLNYMMARYQNGRVGRFISVDPAYRDIGGNIFEQKYDRSLQQHLVNPQSLNGYSYANNNPLIYRDENGEILPLVAAGAAVWAIAEFGLSAYDAYSTYQTVVSSNVSFNEKAGSAILFGAGIIGPGGGYKTIGGKAGDAIQAVKGAGALSSEVKNVLRGSQNPVVKEALKDGQINHSLYKINEVSSSLKKEFKFDNGLRADAIDFKNKVIYELKPDNNKAIQKGVNQVNKYVQQAQKQFGGTFKGVVETYKRLTK